MKLGGSSAEFLQHLLLLDERATVSLQLLGLHPATKDDDPTLNFDWHSCRMSSEHTFTVPGRLIQPINLDLVVPSEPDRLPFYLANSQFLVV